MSSRPFWRLQPEWAVAGKETKSILAMTFPVSVVRRYLIACTSENGYRLIEEEDSKPEEMAVLVVGTNAKVNLEVGVKCEYEVRVNDRLVENGTTSAILKTNDQVKMGNEIYVLQRKSSEIADLRMSMHQLIQCSICLRACQEPALLKCGHSFCTSCLSHMMGLAMSSASNEQPNRLDHHLAGFVDEREYKMQTRSIKCAVCRRPYTCYEAYKAYNPLALKEAIGQIQEWIDYDETRPKCASCQDSRCLVDLRDYEFCDDCRMILCPVCAVENHRDHRLRDRASILKAMHDSGKRLIKMKTSLREVKRLSAVVEAEAANVAQALSRMLNQFVPPVRESTNDCQRIVTEVEGQTRPFGIIDESLIDTFNEAVRMTEVTLDKVQEIVERLSKILTEGARLCPKMSENE